ncbi:ferredoxin [Nocardioides rubriscoriae]|uniref:ferredoxin n=1 Tax=Nocardioides rubriscoriae TaxID=642762 RepID=UPI0011DF131B|nr:ferredoxin [Nocardioides rubriscoriae]
MGARIHVDYDKCEGLGMCEAMASDYFELRESADGDDEMHVLQQDVPEADRAHVHAATQACPVLALTLEG